MQITQLEIDSRSKKQDPNRFCGYQKPLAAVTLIILSLTGCATGTQVTQETKEPDIYLNVCGNVNEFIGIYLEFDTANTVQKAEEVAAEFRTLATEDPQAEFYASILDGFVNTGGTGAENPEAWGDLVKFCDSRR